jgi:hypothetical protein
MSSKVIEDTMRLYHGSYALFDKFDRKFIGSNSELSKLGHGFYAARKKEDAEDYVNPYLYVIDVPADDGENYFPWTNRANRRVFQRLSDVLANYGYDRSHFSRDYFSWRRENGDRISYVAESEYCGEFYQAIAKHVDDDFAVQVLQEAGYIGTRRGTRSYAYRNYTVFDPDDITIVERYKATEVINGNSIDRKLKYERI